MLIFLFLPLMIHDTISPLSRSPRLTRFEYNTFSPSTHASIASLRSLASPLHYTHSNGYPYPEGPQVMAFYPQFYHKTDREGRPIYIEQLGKLDTSKLASLTNQDRQLHHLVDEYEKFLGSRLPATSKVTGGLVETSCTILDLTNAGISTFYKGE